MLYWDPRPEIFVIPFLNWPVFWYGVLFGLGFVLGFPLFVSILKRFFSLCTEYSPEIAQQKAFLITDRLTVYMVVATVLGARLGHFLFYEKPEEYLLHPLEIFKIWEGGLASHGAVLGIILGVFLFQRKSLSFTSSLNWLRLLDFISIPAALCGFWIRIGNFFNQEVLGKATQLPWGVIFGHPVDHQLLQEPRHPVQIYEALFYLGVFYFLWRLSLKPYFLKSSGKLIGLFLILVFGFRFFVEYVKMEQSQLVSFSFLTMGQILSIPVVFLGFCFYKRVSTK